MRKLIKKYNSMLKESWSFGIYAAKDRQIKSISDIPILTSLCLLLLSIAEVGYSVYLFASAGGYQAQIEHIKQTYINDAIGLNNVYAGTYGILGILVNIVLIITAAAFAYDFLKSDRKTWEKIRFFIPTAIAGIIGIIVILQKLTGTSGKGILLPLCNYRNSRVPEDYVMWTPDMAASYLLILMFLVLLISCLVMLLDPTVREFCKYIFPNIVLYFFICPLIIFVAENALSFGGTILGVVGIFLLLGLFIFGVSIFDETDAQRAARLFDEADQHERDAKHGGFIGAVTGENERNEALAYAKRAEARRLVFKEGLETRSEFADRLKF